MSFVSFHYPWEDLVEVSLIKFASGQHYTWRTYWWTSTRKWEWVKDETSTPVFQQSIGTEWVSSWIYLDVDVAISIRKISMDPEFLQNPNGYSLWVDGHLGGEQFRLWSWKHPVGYIPVFVGSRTLNLEGKCTADDDIFSWPNRPISAYDEVLQTIRWNPTLWRVSDQIWDVSVTYIRNVSELYSTCLTNTRWGFEPSTHIYSYLNTIRNVWTNIRWATTNIGPLWAMYFIFLTNIWRITLNICRQMFDVIWPISDVLCPFLDLSWPIIDLFWPILDLSCPILDFFWPILDLFCPILDAF